MENIETLKENVINAIAIRLTFDGALQRANIYSTNAADSRKAAYRKDMAKELFNCLEQIQSTDPYTDDSHYDMLKRLSDNMSTKYQDILIGGRLRLGNTQKFLNLYWKVRWLLNKNIKQPIHCPFDSIIIKKLDKSVRNYAWTKFDTIEIYTMLVEAAKRTAGENSIAEWELKVYSAYKD